MSLKSIQKNFEANWTIDLFVNVCVNELAMMFRHHFQVILQSTKTALVAIQDYYLV